MLRLTRETEADGSVEFLGVRVHVHAMHKHATYFLADSPSGVSTLKAGSPTSPRETQDAETPR